MSNIQNDFISGIGNTPLIKLKAANHQKLQDVIFMVRLNF